MAKLNRQDCDHIETMLNSYSALCDAEKCIGKRGKLFSVTVSDTYNDSDFVSVSVDTQIAKAAISQQKASVAKELSKYKIDVS